MARSGIDRTAGAVIHRFDKMVVFRSQREGSDRILEIELDSVRERVSSVSNGPHLFFKSQGPGSISYSAKVRTWNMERDTLSVPSTVGRSAVIPADGVGADPRWRRYRDRLHHRLNADLHAAGRRIRCARPGAIGQIESHLAGRVRNRVMTRRPPTNKRIGRLCTGRALDLLHSRWPSAPNTAECRT